MNLVFLIMVNICKNNITINTIKQLTFYFLVDDSVNSNTSQNYASISKTSNTSKGS